ncbi:MAG: glycosyltransferase family 4 protein [Gammaproteobacteria bacterium]
MRIAYVDPQSYHGLAKYDLGYLRGLLDSGFDGDVLFYCSTLYDGPVPASVEPAPIFDYNRKRSEVLKAVYYLRSLLRLAIDAFSRPAALYHFQWFKLPWLDLLLVVLLKKALGARVAMTAHNVVPHGTEGRRHRALARLYRTVDAIVVHHRKTADEIAARFGIDSSRIHVLRHGPIKIDGRGRARHRRTLKRFAAQHPLNFLFLGRGSRYKGLDILLDAWALFDARTSAKAGLIVIGAVDPELKDMAAKAARRHASLLLIDERVSEADLHLALRRADIVVLPHRRISQSGVLLSALGQRKPVLVAPRPGLLEPLEMATVGWRFDGGAEGLAARLEFLASHPEEVARIRDDRDAWKLVQDAYAWRTIGRNATDVYRRLIERPAGTVASSGVES